VVKSPIVEGNGGMLVFLCFFFFFSSLSKAMFFRCIGEKLPIIRAATVVHERVSNKNIGDAGRGKNMSFRSRRIVGTESNNVSFPLNLDQGLQMAQLVT